MDRFFEPDISDNERHLLSSIWTRGPIARSDLAGMVGKTGASVSRMTQKLIELDLVEDQVVRSGANGPPKRPLSIKPETTFSFGVNFTPQTIDVALVDLTGTVIHSTRAQRTSQDVAEIADISAAQIRTLIEQNNIRSDRIVGVGVAAPGNFDGAGKTIIAHQSFPELANQDLGESFGRSLEYPIFVENDGTAAAIGELLLGAGRRRRNFLLIHLGDGIGGGVIADGKPYRGAHGNAGLFGVLFPYGKPRPSALDLLETLRKEGVQVRDFSELAQIGSIGDTIIQEWIMRVTTQLRWCVEVAGSALDPEWLLIGGRLPEALNQRIASSVAAAVRDRPETALPLPPIAAARFGMEHTAVGVACVPFQKQFYSAQIDRSGFESAASR